MFTIFFVSTSFYGADHTHTYSMYMNTTIKRCMQFQLLLLPTLQKRKSNLVLLKINSLEFSKNI